MQCTAYHLPKHIFFPSRHTNLKSSRYCNDDIDASGAEAKKWMVGDPLNPESFEAVKYRCTHTHL